MSWKMKVVIGLLLVGLGAALAFNIRQNATIKAKDREVFAKIQRIGGLRAERIDLNKKLETRDEDLAKALEEVTEKDGRIRSLLEITARPPEEVRIEVPVEVPCDTPEGTIEYRTVNVPFKPKRIDINCAEVASQVEFYVHCQDVKLTYQIADSEPEVLSFPVDWESSRFVRDVSFPVNVTAPKNLLIVSAGRSGLGKKAGGATYVRRLPQNRLLRKLTPAYFGGQITFISDDTVYQGALGWEF